MKICVLGSGIAGLLASKALDDCGYDFDIYTDAIMCEMKTLGLHYLHDSCGLNLRHEYIYNLVIGDDGYMPLHDQYCKKVFGELNITRFTNSLVNLPAYNRIYDIKKAFEMLFDSYVDKMKTMDVIRDNIKILRNEYDLIISTIPLHYITGVYKCDYEEVYIRNKMPWEAPIDMIREFCYKNYVVYNIDKNIDWYRLSVVDHMPTAEYAGGHNFYELLDAKDIKITKKVISSGVDTKMFLRRNRIFLTGRWGAWDRAQLAHDTYYNVLNILKMEGN